jgi:hypothetical protein
MSKEDAFKNTVECITGPITKIISTKGIKAGAHTRPLLTPPVLCST